MVMGSSSEYNSRLALTKLTVIINTTMPGMCCRVKAFDVVNRVASVKLNYDLDVERLAQDWKYMGLWEKTSFPGFKFRMDDLNLTCVLFPKGVSFRAISSHTGRVLIHSLTNHLLLCVDRWEGQRRGCTESIPPTADC